MGALLREGSHPISLKRNEYIDQDVFSTKCENFGYHIFLNLHLSPVVALPLVVQRLFGRWSFLQGIYFSLTLPSQNVKRIVTSYGNFEDFLCTFVPKSRTSAECLKK